MSGTPPYKLYVKQRYHAWSTYRSCEWIIMSGSHVLGAGTTANEAWKAAWLGIRARDLAGRGETPPLPAPGGLTACLTVRVPSTLAQAVTAKGRAEGMSLQDITIELYSKYVGAADDTPPREV